MSNRLSHPGAPNVYLFLKERDRQGVRGGGAERERERERERTPSRLHTVSTEPRSGLSLMNCEIKT